MTAQEALSLLQEGNNRYCQGLRSVDQFATAEKIKELAERGQRPFAVVLTCSDSRVPAEMLFDRGLGDLFVIRVAGNIIGPNLLASIEFAALELGTPLCLVMGHTGCGAIKATVDYLRKSEKPPTQNLASLMEKIEPAIRLAQKLDGEPGKTISLLDRATIENVRNTKDQIYANSEVLRRRIAEGRFSVVGSVYDLHSGRVNLLTDEREIAHPKTHQETA